MPTDRTATPVFAQDIIQTKTPFRRALLAWYRRERRELPWRDAADPYVIWITEIILQQTRVDQGTPYIQRFLDAFPNVQTLANAELDEVLKVWEGLGYYTRARNIHRAAGVVASERNGKLPVRAEDWQSLPGIGRYTAGAIASISHGEAVPVLDGNVKRVLARVTNLPESIDDPKVTDRLWQLAETLVQGKSPGDFNQALMELGARICIPRAPICDACPVHAYCQAYKSGTQARLPMRREKKPVPHHEIVVAAIKKNGRYLLGQRPPNGLLGGLWEFPGGKLAPGEDHATALAREIREELGIEVSVGGLIASVKHAYTHFKITLNVYLCQPNGGKPKPNAHTQLKWVRPAEFKTLAFPKANHKFLHLL